MPVQGSFEIIDRYFGIGWFAKGWAFDPDNAFEPVDLLLWADGKPIQVFKADRYRADLKDAGFAGGHCAFELKIPDQLMDGLPHRLEVIVAQENRFLPRAAADLFFPSLFEGQICLTSAFVGQIEVYL